MLNRNRYHQRHAAIVTPDDFPWPIHVVGLGAVGSYATLFLAKLGVRTCTSTTMIESRMRTSGTSCTDRPMLGDPKHWLSRIVSRRPPASGRSRTSNEFSGESFKVS